MTWPDAIAAALGVIAALLIVIHQHRSTTETADPQDGEPRT